MFDLTSRGFPEYFIPCCLSNHVSLSRWAFIGQKHCWLLIFFANCNQLFSKPRFYSLWVFQVISNCLLKFALILFPIFCPVILKSLRFPFRKWNEWLYFFSTFMHPPLDCISWKSPKFGLFSVKGIYKRSFRVIDKLDSRCIGSYFHQQMF